MAFTPNQRSCKFNAFEFLTFLLKRSSLKSFAFSTNFKDNYLKKHCHQCHDILQQTTLHEAIHQILQQLLASSCLSLQSGSILSRLMVYLPLLSKQSSDIDSIKTYSLFFLFCLFHLKIIINVN